MFSSAVIWHIKVIFGMFISFWGSKYIVINATQCDRWDSRFRFSLKSFWDNIIQCHCSLLNGRRITKHGLKDREKKKSLVPLKAAESSVWFLKLIYGRLWNRLNFQIIFRVWILTRVNSFREIFKRMRH